MQTPSQECALPWCTSRCRSWLWLWLQLPVCCRQSGEVISGCCGGLAPLPTLYGHWHMSIGS